jgi:hypothetical protein
LFDIRIIGQTILDIPSKSQTMTEEQPMFIEEGESVFFPRVGLCLHKSFSDKFKNLTFPQARRKLQKFFIHSQQDHIMHYLKNKGITISPFKN